MPGGIVALFILGVIVVIGFAIYAAYASAKRRNEIAAWALSKGLVFSQEKVRDVEYRFPFFDCLRQGSKRYALNTMQGNYSGRGIFAFDYHYETTSTDSKGHQQTHHHYFSAVILFSKIPLKPLFIRPEGLFDKLAGLVGFEDINFESAEFSRRFFVKAPDRKWAYDVIHARTIEFLLAMPQFKLQFDPQCVIAWRDARFEAPEFEQAAEVIKGILDRLPEYVVKQQEGIS